MRNFSKSMIVLCILVSILMLSSCNNKQITSKTLLLSGDTSDRFKLYLNHSIKERVAFYVNESDTEVYVWDVVPGEKYVFGGELI